VSNSFRRQSTRQLHLNHLPVHLQRNQARHDVVPLGLADLPFSKVVYGARRLIAVRGTKLPRVAQYDLTAVQVDFPDAVEISRHVGELAGAAREVDGVGDDGVQPRGATAVEVAVAWSKERVSPDSVTQ
jgi:hypothetical protein